MPHYLVLTALIWNEYGLQKSVIFCDCLQVETSHRRICMVCMKFKDSWLMF